MNDKALDFHEETGGQKIFPRKLLLKLYNFPEPSTAPQLPPDLRSVIALWKSLLFRQNNSFVCFQSYETV